MKRIWILVLLISLGLNLGLGMRLMKDQGRERDRIGGPRDRGSGRFQGRWADRDSMSRQKLFNRRMDHMANSLELDPDQREAFRRVHSETGRILMRKRAVISEKRDLLHELVTADQVDKDGIRRAITELGQEQAVLDSLVAETLLQEMGVLTPDQRVRYLEMLSFERGGREGKHGRDRPGRRSQ